MDISDKVVAVLVHNYFEQAEFEEPISALRDAGAEVVVIAARDSDLQALKHVKFGDKFKADLSLDHANAEDYDAVVLPGGVVNADNLRVDLRAQEFILELLDNGKPVAAICHAPWLLVSAEGVEGRRLTSYFTLRDDIINAGGEWVDLPVVVDDNLITSRDPDDLPYFNDQIISMLSTYDDNDDSTASYGKSDTAKSYRRRSSGAKSTRLSVRDDILGLGLLDEDDDEARLPSSMIPGEEED